MPTMLVPGFRLTARRPLPLRPTGRNSSELYLATWPSEVAIMMSSPTRHFCTHTSSSPSACKPWGSRQMSDQIQSSCEVNHCCTSRI